MISRVVPWALAVAFAICAAWLVHRAWSVESEAERAAEAKQLEAEGQIVELQRTRDALDHDLDVALAENSKLSDALDEAREAAPDAKVTRVVRASTGPMIVDGHQMPVKCQSNKPYAELTPLPTCLVSPGDSLEVRVNEVDLLTKAGNTVIVGTGECLRVSPPPETSLASGKFEASLTHVSGIAPPPPDDRWPWYVHEAIGVGVGFAAAVAAGKL